MSSNKEKLEERLRNQMVDVVKNGAPTLLQEADAVATDSIRNMEITVRERQGQLRQQLKTKMTEVFRLAVPQLQSPTYDSLVDKLESLVIDRFSSLRHTSMIKQNYSRLEQNLLVMFLNAIPGATGSSTALARDLMADHLIHSFELASLRFSIGELHYVRNFFDTVFTLFAGLSKAGLSETAQQIYDEREKLLLSGLRSSLQQTKNEGVIYELRTLCETLLESAALNLNDYQVRNVCDQLFWLFRDFVNAPEEERNQIYASGEERIIVSTFDPNGFMKPALSQAVE